MYLFMRVKLDHYSHPNKSRVKVHFIPFYNWKSINYVFKFMCLDATPTHCGGMAAGHVLARFDCGSPEHPTGPSVTGPRLEQGRAICYRAEST
jgi:hypothetical protein